jgi:dethiobiotin synthetase/adenosylmethionine--8-amino-7-oxononanoate aminotransferase
LRTDSSALITADASIKSDKPFEDFHIHSRPLGNVLYMMTSLHTDTAVVRSIENTLRAKLAQGW